jgi:hypothetical protein
VKRFARVVIYPYSGLVSINQTLWRFRSGCGRLGFHTLQRLTGITVSLHPYALSMLMAYITFHANGSNPEYAIRPVGLRAVRAMQRRVRQRGKRLAVAMALHARLGVASTLGALGSDLLELIVGLPAASAGRVGRLAARGGPC